MLLRLLQEEPASQNLLEKTKAALEDWLPTVVTWMAGRLPALVFILVGTWVALRVGRGLVGRLQRFLEGKSPEPGEVRRIQTLAGIVRQVLRIVIVAVGALMFLFTLGVPVAPILTAAGIGGLAIGFGAQSLVKDVITGFFILLENQVRVGDIVQVTGIGGLVESVGIRTLRLRDLSGNVHIIPHGAVDKVTNLTKEFSMYLFEVGVAYREDPDEVIRVVQGIAEEMRGEPSWKGDILDPLETIGVDRFADSAVVIRFRFKTKPLRQWAVGREMNRRIWKKFNAVGIEIPFPHRTLYFGEPKSGTAPPAQVRMVEAGGKK